MSDVAQVSAWRKRRWNHVGNISIKQIMAKEMMDYCTYFNVQENISITNPRYLKYFKVFNLIFYDGMHTGKHMKYPAARIDPTFSAGLRVSAVRFSSRRELGITPRSVGTSNSYGRLCKLIVWRRLWCDHKDSNQFKACGYPASWAVS